MATEAVPADSGGIGNHLQSILIESELSKLPFDVVKKVNDYIDVKFEEYLTAKALLDASRNTTGDVISKLENDLLEITAKYEDAKTRLAAAYTTTTELERQLTELKNECNRIKETSSRQESEIITLKSARDAAVDERNDLTRALQRRDAELERLRSDEASLSTQLRSAIDAKCEAMASTDEMQSKELSVQYRERRMEQERVLLNSEIAGLNEEVNRLTNELKTVRLNNTSRLLTLESQLSEKIEELSSAENTISQLNEAKTNLSSRAENLAQRLLDHRDMENKMCENYKKELDAKTKLAELYKGMQDDAEAKTAELTGGILELQKLLHEATEKYGELETKNKQMEMEHEEIIEKKNEIIASLKLELENANELLKAANNQNLDIALGELAPSAAAASKLLKSGMSLTQVYSQLVLLTDELAKEKKENKHLTMTISTVVRELEEKAPILRQQKMDYEEALENNTAMSRQIDAMVMECNRLRDDYSESSKVANHHTRENARLKGELADLGRQVCFLLKEVEQSRGRSVPNGDQDSSNNTSNTTHSSDLSSSRIISKTLVTFGDIQELQTNNQKLLRLVRDLTAKQEEFERNHEQMETGEMQAKMETLGNRVAELTDAQDRQTKMVNGLIRQRDMYKKLYHDNMKGRDVREIPTTLERPENSTANVTTAMDISNDGSPKTKSESQLVLETKLTETEKHMQLLKEEHKTYKEEKLTNEKMLFEQIDNMRKEMAKLTASNSKSSSVAEYNNERLKILQANVSTYKKQISSLEEKNKVYSGTIAKHEMSIQHLRDETMNAQSKLARAEVTADNLKQECKLLKDAESRLQTEREMLNRERHGQALLLNNLEMIKASLERSETEGRMRLETRLDEATRECAAVRRRLQEEQDRFRELAAHLELQTQTAKSRMEEEKASADVLRADLGKLKQDYDEKTLHNEELTKKLNMAMMPNKPDGSFDTVKKIKDLERQLNESQALVLSLQEQLNISKEHVSQYCNISESAEKELKELNETFMNYKNETEIKLANAQKAEQHLEDKCSELEAELSLQNNGQHTSNADLKFQLTKITEQLQSTMKTLEETKADLDGAREEVTKLSQSVQLAEEKYAREMVLHSNDIQLLTQLKEEMSKLRLEMNNIKALKDRTLEKLESDQKSWLEREKLLQSEREELLSRLDNLNKQNSVLHDQIQALGTQLSIAHTPRQGEAMNESGNETNMNVSLTEDDHKSSEQLFQIIKFLRKEKDIAVAKYDILQAENARLKSQVEIIEKQLDETKLALAAEREKAEVNVVTIAKHSEILRKVETLNAITDSNRILREERDNLLSRVNELTSTTKRLEEELLPLQEKIGEITSKNDTLQSENTSLKTETARWRTRVNSLVERANKTSPEDWKRLQNERETLAKMLTNEKENIKKLNEELSSIKIEKTKLEEQCTNLTRQHASLSEDYKKQTEELNTSKNDLTKLTEELNKAKSAVNEKSEENVKVNELLASKELVLADIRNKEMQIRKIAKKYKAQYEELCKTVEEEKKKTDGEAVATGAAAAEEIKAAEQKAESLQAQLDAGNAESEKLKAELETLRTANLEKEEKARHVLKQAKSKIVQLTEIKNSLNRELVESKTKIDSLEQSNRDEQDVRLAVLKSQYEGRLTRLEKERTEAQAERTREVDALLQKVNLLQRQLASQSSSTKQQTSGTDKVVTEPPTANIKPLAAGAPQQSVCGQRRGGDTPLASIRPMAHAPDAHSTEYMPASSSRPHHMRAPHPTPAPPPAPAPPESTQDMESEARPGSATASDTTAQQPVHSQPPQQVVALVLPRIEQPPIGAATVTTVSASDVSASAVSASAVSASAVSAATAEPGQLQAASSTGGVSTSGASGVGAADTRPAKRARAADARPVTASAKRTRVQGFERSVDVEYQVPTSSRCDQDDDGVIVVDSEEDDDNRCSGTAYQEGEGYTEEDEEEEEEGMEEGAEGEEEDETEEGLEEEEAEEEGSAETAGGEASTIGEGAGEEAAPAGDEASQESPAQSSAGETGEAGEAVAAAPQADQHQQIEAISSGTEPITLSSGGGGSVAGHATGPSYEDGDDSIVPSTPTLYVPRRNDGFGEAVSSPVAGGGVGAGGRFTFGEAGGAGGMEDTHADLAAQLAPAPAAAPAGTGSGDAEQAEESSVGGGGEDDGAAVSSQGSQPASPHQVAEEGREAEASASPSRGSPRRRTFKPHHRPTPILWPNEMDGRGGGRGGRGGRGRGVHGMRGRGFMRY